MNVYTKFGGTYKWDPVRNLHFEDLTDTRNDIDLHIGKETSVPVNSDSINVFLDLEQPNTWYGGPTCRAFRNAKSREETFDKIYTINKPVANKRNAILGEKKYVYTFFPFSLKHLPAQSTKVYNAFFSGHWYGNKYCLQREIIGPAWQNLKKTIQGFDFFIVSGYHEGRNLSYDEKLAENAKSKISIAYNHQEFGSRFNDMLPSIKAEYTDVEKDSTGHLCINQHKARVIEGFMSKTLVLVYNDPFNSIEDFWTPDEHFIYYSNAAELESKIADINENYNSDKYQNIINAGHEFTKAEFSVEQFYNKYIKDL
tara:strand:- start:779 stop:1714 length:936 start_codon:yes stop_codon:yes gene_type:complete